VASSPSNFSSSKLFCDLPNFPLGQKQEQQSKDISSSSDSLQLFSFKPNKTSPISSSSPPLSTSELPTKDSIFTTKSLLFSDSKISKPSEKSSLKIASQLAPKSNKSKFLSKQSKKKSKEPDYNLSLPSKFFLLTFDHFLRKELDKNDKLDKSDKSDKSDKKQATFSKNPSPDIQKGLIFLIFLLFFSCTFNSYV